MNQDPFGSRNPQSRRRGAGGLRLWVLVLFAGYAAYYWYSNRTVDPYTGEEVMIDKGLSAEDESAMGLQAYREILGQERAVDPDAQVARQIRAIAERLISRVDEVEADLAAEKGVQPRNFAGNFEWQVSVIESGQANAFALPGGKMAVYTGLVPIARNADGMAVVMGHEIAHALMRHGAQRMARGKLEQIGQMAGAASGMDAGTLQTVMSAYGVTSALPYARPPTRARKAASRTCRRCSRRRWGSARSTAGRVAAQPRPAEASRPRRHQWTGRRARSPFAGTGPSRAAAARMQGA